ncbi:MAG: hypothetical protein VX000_04360, partial [Myxococcota bacterium]|nr:hypothetical protein [Myxococcota bacterium]
VLEQRHGSAPTELPGLLAQAAEHTARRASCSAAAAAVVATAAQVCLDSDAPELERIVDGGDSDS